MHLSLTLDRLLLHRPVITDGAWGTQLQARGLAIGECPEAWNLRFPERVEEVARAYVAAGSRVLLTNTFGANRFALQRHGLAEQAVEINRAGVAISRRAAGNRVAVFASVGPTGQMMMDADQEAIREAFEEQTAALAEAGADAMVVETMSDLHEAILATTAAVATGLPVVVCMAFGVGRTSDRTLMGVAPEEAAHALEEAGASVIGTNCGMGAEAMLPICRRLRAATNRPLWMKPNAGLPELVEGKAVYKTTPAEFATAARALVQAGADFIGGCCGTGPDFIRRLAEELRA
jgi:methionine synthase I (cobalamin-dependent)